MKKLVSLVILLVLLEVRTGQCKDNTWTHLNGSDYEYYFHRPSSHDMTWYGARAVCMQMGADLVKINNQAEIDFLKGLPYLFGADSWIGLNKLQGYFQWTDGSLLGDFKSWDQDQPDNDDVNRKLCVYMQTSPGKWSSANCGIKKSSAFCSREVTNITPTPKTEPTTPTLPGYCPLGYIDTDSKCYKLFSTPVSWDEALTACRSEPGRSPDLASFQSSRDNAFVTSQIKPKSMPLWIGSKTDRFSYPWAWSDNSDMTYQNTNGGSPSGCLATYGSQPDIPGTWFWKVCTERYGYVCQTHKDPDNIINTPQPTTSHPCKEGFIPFGEGCYRFQSEAATWSTAESMCEEQGAHLVAIHSEAENAAVEILSEGSDMWIGLKKGADGEYEWSNGWYVLYTRWSKGSSDSGNCVKMYGENGTWKGENCALKLPYLCKVSTGPALTTPTPIEGRCPPEGGWVAHGSYCYLFQLQTGKSWYGAMDACLAQYQTAQLVSIHHMVDNDWLHKQIKERENLFKVDMWIGLHRSQKDGSLRWVDGSAVQFQHWVVGRPVDKDCTVMSKDHSSMWMDKECDGTQAGYVCKAPKIPLPTRPTDGPGSCPGAGWESFGSSCFLYRPDEASKWYEAQELCLQEGGTLASILSDHENFYIHLQMMNHTHLPKYRPFWTGGVRINSTLRFGWLGGSGMVYSHWGKEYPTSSGDCVLVNPETSVWRNHDCNSRAGVVCRYDKVAAQAPPYNGNGMSGGAIVGIVIGLLVIVGLTVAVVFLLYTRHQNRSQAPYPSFNNPLSPCSQTNSTSNINSIAT